MSEFDEQMMQRCIQLAKNGLGQTYPNPMVGCVITLGNEIIAESWHQKAGEPHAEVNAIQQLTDKSILKQSTLYVSLEPCAHFGKTPPCSDLIIQHEIPKVVIGTSDPFAKVNGLGTEKMRKAGIEVKVGVLENQAQALNKRFFTFHQNKRPYIILKWAETTDGFISTESGEQKWITNIYSKQIVHQWRTEEQAILVGRKTAQFDNPQLNARLWKGNQPVRIVPDRNLNLNEDLNLFDQSQTTLVFTEKIKENSKNLNFVSIDFDADVVQQILNHLYEIEIQSIIIEGGKQTLMHFIDRELWDEARILKAKNNFWNNGIKAPILDVSLKNRKKLDTDTLEIYQR